MRTVRVIFKDDTSISIDGVKDWYIDNEFNMFFLFKETRKVMIPRENVKIIGYAEDFNNGLMEAFG